MLPKPGNNCGPNKSICFLEFGAGHEQTGQDKQAPTDSLGWSPTLPRDILVQLQPRGGQSWQSGVWQLEMGLVPCRVFGDGFGAQQSAHGALQALAVSGHQRFSGPHWVLLFMWLYQLLA